MLLERSLVFTFAMHGLGMLAMVLFLLPGMPGGGAIDDAARVSYIASHPWLWRLGWLPWQLTAVSDLLLSFALLRTAWVPRAAAWITLLVTIAAVIPDQFGQIAWITKGIALAREGDLAAYLAYEKRIFAYTSVWGGVLYTVGALGWTWCFAAGGAWSRGATALSGVLWPLFFVATLGPVLGIGAGLVAAANAVGFVLLQAWFVVVAGAVHRRTRSRVAHGPAALYEQLLSPVWDTLPDGVRAVHRPGEARGEFSVRWGDRPLAKTLARVLRLPHPGDRVDVQLSVTPCPGGLRWVRRMGGDTFVTEQTVQSGLLCESFGLIECGFDVTSEGTTIAYQQRYAGLRFLWYRVPLPSALWPRVAATSSAHADGALTRVEVAAPWVGRLLRYEGIVRSNRMAERATTSAPGDGA